MSSGIKLTREDSEKVKEKLSNLKKQHRQSNCKRCGENILFKRDEHQNMVPHNLDESPHWQSCPYSTFAQKRVCINITKKFGVYFLAKHSSDLSKEIGLTQYEERVVSAIVDKALRDTVVAGEQPAEDSVVEGELSFEPIPGGDPIGDPDEDRAPEEDLVSEADLKEIGFETPSPQPELELSVKVDEEDPSKD